MNIQPATDPYAWDAFLATQPWRPFLQSWTMGEVYRELGQSPVRLTLLDQGKIRGICFAHSVPARRGKHLSVPYGPLFDYALRREDFREVLPKLFLKLKEIAHEYDSSFVRMSPFLGENDGESLLAELKTSGIKAVSSPLHLLAEHVWYLPLREILNYLPPEAPGPRSLGEVGLAKEGQLSIIHSTSPIRSEEEILMGMRKTTRNLIRRAEKEGVEVEVSSDPVKDLPVFMKLHNETKKRHGFTPYTDAFFESQVRHFSAKGQCTLYLARYKGEVIATSIHIHAFGETSYHHGASGGTHPKIPASYLLQWKAIQDALKRGDHLYNFWGIAPVSDQRLAISDQCKAHPFSGVTLFKTGFGGQLINLIHCHDIPVKPSYWLTYGFETVRKWRRGF